jgi:hypothetical protein
VTIRAFGPGAIGYDSFEWRSGGVCLYVYTNVENRRLRRRRSTRNSGGFNCTYYNVALTLLIFTFFFSQPLAPDTPSILCIFPSRLSRVIINQRLRHRPFRQRCACIYTDVLRAMVSVYGEDDDNFEKSAWK